MPCWPAFHKHTLNNDDENIHKKKTKTKTDGKKTTTTTSDPPLTDARRLGAHTYGDDLPIRSVHERILAVHVVEVREASLFDSTNDTHQEHSAGRPVVGHCAGALTRSIWRASPKAPKPDEQGKRAEIVHNGNRNAYN